MSNELVESLGTHVSDPRIAAVMKEIFDNKRDLDHARSEVTDLERRLALAEAEKRQLQNEVDRMRAQRDELQQENSDLRAHFKIVADIVHSVNTAPERAIAERPRISESNVTPLPRSQTFANFLHGNGNDHHSDEFDDK